MKKFLYFMLAAVLAVTVFTGCAGAKEDDKLSAIKKAGKIVMGTSPDYAPMEFIDLTKSGPESIVGSDIELGKYIAAKLGVELEIEAMEFSAVQAAITQGEIDMGISGFSYTEDRAQSMLLSDYYGDENEFGQGLLVLKENVDVYSTPEAFEGKTVAAQNASLQYNLASSQLPGATLEPITNLQDAILMLINGKVDALAVSGDNGLAFTQNYEDIAMASFMFEYESEGMVIACTSGQQPLMDVINEALTEVRDQGLYEEWRAEHYALAQSLGIEQ